MSADNQEADFERLLITSLARAIDFVRFAETKNAALLTFSSAWLLGLANISRGDHYPDGLVSASRLAVVFFLSAVLVSFWSLLPRRRLLMRSKVPRPESLTYFGDIAKLDPATYRRLLFTTYMSSNAGDARTAYFDDLVMQIAVNSTIADRKFSQFAVGGSFVLCGLGVIFSFTVWQALTWLAGHG